MSKVKFLLLFLVVLSFQCKNTPTAETATAVAKQKDNSEANVVVDTGPVCPSLQDFVRSIGYTYAVKSTFNEVTRNATLKCFIDNYAEYFKSMKVEEYVEVSKNQEGLNIAFNIKKMKFENAETSQKLFDAYAKGFHDKCMGTKEPHFLMLENEVLSIFYVDAERDRKLLKAVQGEIVEGLLACRHLDFNLMIK